MKKYAGIFAAAYLLLTVVTAGIAYLLRKDPGVILNIVMAMGASVLASWRFTIDLRRLPTRGERKMYAWLALLTTWLVSLCMFAALAAMTLPLDVAIGLLQMFSSALVVAAMAVLSLVFYFTIQWSFYGYARWALAGKDAAARESLHPPL